MKFGIGQGIKRFRRSAASCAVRAASTATCPFPGKPTPSSSALDAPRTRRSKSVDASAALKAPGVLGRLHRQDVAGLGTMQMTLKRKRPDGSPMFRRRIRALAQERAPLRRRSPRARRRGGHTHRQKMPPILVSVDYEPLPS